MMNSGLNPIDEKVDELSLGNLYPPTTGETSIPIEKPAFGDTFHEFFSGDTLAPPIQSQPEKPGFIESVKQGFSENDLNLIYQYQSTQQDMSSPLDDPKPDGWNPSDQLNNFEGIDPMYYPYMLEASGPKDSNRRYFNVLDMQEKQRRYDDGSMLGHAIGLLAGGVVSPSSWIPLGIEIKAARLSARLLQDIPKIIPGVAAGAAAHNVAVETSKVTGNMENFITNTFRDTVAGTAFMGTLMGLGHGFTASKVWNARRVVNEMKEGIELVPVVKEDGSFDRLLAVSESASAAKVSFAQKFADSSMAQKGLFGVPVIGGWLGKGAATVNPIIRGLNSPFITMRGFMDRAASHGIATEGNLAGIASPDKFEVKMAALNGDNTQFMWWLKGLHLERNGLDSSKRIRGGFAEAKMKWKDDGYVTPEMFMDEIENVVINETPSAHATVNEAASAIREKLDNSYREFREAYNLPETWLSPKTAKGYLNRVYDIDYMRINEDNWNTTVVKYLKEADATIKSYMQPIRDLREQVKLAENSHQKFIRQKNLTSAQIKESADKLLSIKKQLRQRKNSVQNALREDENLRMHVEDIGALSAKEAIKLKKILKPLKKLAKDLSIAKENVKKKKFDLLKSESASSKAKSKEVAAKNVENADKLRKEVQALEDDVNLKQDAHDIEEERLQESIRNNEIDPTFYERIPGSQRYKFKKTTDRLKFRKEYQSEYHMATEAKSYYQSILNNTAEDINAQVMGTLLGRHGENPLKQRSLLIPDNVLYEAKFLSKNLGVNVANYRNVLGRKTILKNVYKDVTIDGGIEPIIEQLRQEFLGMKEALNSKLSALRAKKKQTKKDKNAIADAEKEIISLDKQYNYTKEDMNLAYNKMMGRNRGSEKQRKYSSIVRNFSVATKLGAVPLTMVTDLMGIAFKHGMWPAVKEGLIPAIKNMRRADSKNAAHANLGMNHVLSAWQDRNWAGTAQPYTPVSGSIADGVERLAHMSSTVAGTNHIENFFQEVSASIIQSKIMRYLMDFKAGKLSAKDREKLLIYGIQPEDWADKMIKSWKATGSDGNDLGGVQSRFWEWADKEASVKMSETVMLATKDTIIRRGMFDAPFALDDPIFGTLFMFKGWALASLTRFLVPLMQRPDAEKFVGTLLMLSAGAMVTPLRRLAKGEDPFQDDDTMWFNAMKDGGVFSSLIEGVEVVNGLTGGQLLKNIKNDKYTGRTISGFIAGPAGGMAEDGARILRMMSTGNFNQTDVNRAVRMIPFTQSWYLRGLSNKAVESLPLPATYSEANK